MKRWYVEVWNPTGTQAEFWKYVDLLELQKLVHNVRAGGNRFVVRIIEPLEHFPN